MANGSIGINVDAKGIDRLAIGGRLYDMLDAGNEFNILHNDGSKLFVSYEDLYSMIKLVNPNIEVFERRKAKRESE